MNQTNLTFGKINYGELNELSCTEMSESASRRSQSRSPLRPRNSSSKQPEATNSIGGLADPAQKRKSESQAKIGTLYHRVSLKGGATHILERLSKRKEELTRNTLTLSPIREPVGHKMSTFTAPTPVKAGINSKKVEDLNKY